MINTRRRPILMIFAITSNKSEMVKKNNNKNLKANSSVNVGTVSALPMVRYFWKLNTHMPRKINGQLMEL